MSESPQLGSAVLVVTTRGLEEDAQTLETSRILCRGQEIILTVVYLVGIVAINTEGGTHGAIIFGIWIISYLFMLIGGETFAELRSDEGPASQLPRPLTYRMLAEAAGDDV